MPKAAVVSANATNSVELLYNPYQQSFLDNKRLRLADGRRAFNRFGLFSGRRGGKTRIGGVGVAEELTVDGSLGWACAPSYPELQDYVIPAVFSVVPNAWIKDWSASKLELTCHNGARVQFRSLDDPERARGPGLDWAWIDEARKVQEKAWDTLLPALVDRRGCAWVTTSPNGFDWCVPSGTLVSVEGGKVEIERLRVGQRVWTRSGWRKVTHVTYMGEKQTLVIEAGGKTLRCTPEHRIATTGGWIEAQAVVPRQVRGVRAGSTASFASFGDEIHPSVGMTLRTMGGSELALHPRGTTDILPVCDGFQMGRVDAQPITAEVIDLQTGQDGPVRDPIGQAVGNILAVDTTNPPCRDQGVPGIATGFEPHPVPQPTVVFVERDLLAEPAEIQLEACEVTRVSHGLIIPVWDIGVEDEPEFVADGILVHNCYKRFYLPAYEGEPGFWACKYKTLDNPFIDPDEVAAARRQLDPMFFQQEFEAEFVSFAGAVYGTLIDDSILKHGEITKVLPYWPNIPAYLPCIVGIDPGADHPFAAVLLVETEAGMVVAGEYVARHKPVADHAFALNHMVGKLRPTQWACDKSQRQTIIELHQHGIMAAPAPNDVVAGITRVGSWLRSRRLWLSEDTCPKLIEQLRAYRWDENVGSDGQMRRERVVKIQDDLADALRYALMLWPFQPTGEIPGSDDVDFGRRDLSKLPDDTRWSLERLRACENGSGEDDENGVDWLAEPEGDGPMGDFWRT